MRFTISHAREGGYPQAYFNPFFQKNIARFNCTYPIKVNSWIPAFAGITLLLLIGLLTSSAFAQEASPKINPADICKGREGCRVLWSADAGEQDKKNYFVSEVVLPHPVKNEWEKCHRPQDDRYGEFLDNVSQEIWLSTFGGLLTDHKKIFELCNNGYGAAALGEDAFKIENNTITYRQSGGGNQRWVWSRSYDLTNLKYAKTLLCDFETGAGGGHMRIMDYESGAFTSGYTPQTDDENMNFIHCDKDTLVDAKPKYKAIDVKQVHSFLGLRLNEVKALGTCATTLASKAGPHQGHIIFGQDDGSDVVVKLIRINDDKLWIDVSDTARIFKATENWANDDRIEIWWLDQKMMDKEPQRRALRQFAIRLADLKVFAGYGYSGNQKLPEVERREGKNGLSIVVSWPPAQFPSPAGLTLSYAHGENGATKVMWATSTFKYADPFSLSPVRNLQEDGKDPMNSCAINKDGVLDLVSPKGLGE